MRGTISFNRWEEKGEEILSYHDDTKYIMVQARFPPGDKGLPKHMHFVTLISRDSLERRNKKPPTPYPVATSEL